MGVLLAGGRTPDGHHPPKIFSLTDDFCFPVSYLIKYPKRKGRMAGGRKGGERERERSVLSRCSRNRLFQPFVVLTYLHRDARVAIVLLLSLLSFSPACGQVSRDKDRLLHSTGIRTIHIRAEACTKHARAIPS